ncbi:hypothetical protein FIV06_09080 [Labrenzia sp. THAF191b]|uniref:VpaChn25_0724 family phage protein n=1 Tax=unclassified Labrenzia TaxID=2648686 RepID=UPI0012693FD3|nr:MULTISPECIES: hypothetical protein [unclassified Labrenzia]QFS97573.1 hypothetical protein FIV06_09080 [Labrenzia sp. THAF191b]QFT03888.1 hypothetical protein FIV05_09080 [Labrenzia sp. THAF191a]QFT15430.1 hypothetical protein FIV03_09085 [Labrenzia sp. THAF187b]
MSYLDVVAADCRLIMLKELAGQNDHQLNETILTKVLENFGHLKTRDYVRTQIRMLEGLNAVSVKEVGSVLVVKLLRAGLDHVERRAFLEGVGRPSVEG